MYGQLSGPQKKRLGEVVKGSTLVDLGAGDGSLAMECIQMGAVRIHAIEPRRPHLSHTHAKIQWTNRYFAEVTPEPVDVAILSWPWEGTQPDALIRLLKPAETIVFLGKTTGGTSCGSKQLWEYLATLKVEQVLPDPKNTLVIYRNQPRNSKRKLAIEAAGLDHETIHPFSPEIWENKKALQKT